MTLANDILRRASVTPKKHQPKPVTVKPKPSVMPISNRNLHMARVPGCHRDVEGWKVTAWDGIKLHHLGAFEMVARARIAWRLWHLWKRRGFSDIPTGNNLTLIR